jgi:hypothetical protein
MIEDVRLTSGDQMAIQVTFDEAELAAVAVNMAGTFACQGTEDGIILTICQSVPPVMVGSAEQQREAFKRAPRIKAKVLGRFCLTRKRANDLAGLLLQSIKMLDTLGTK